MTKDKASQRWVDYFQQADAVDERAIIYARARIAHGPETLEHTALMCDLSYSRSISWLIFPEQTGKGLAWIRKNRNRKALKAAFGLTEWSIFDRFNHFLFVGLVPQSHNERYTSPVYRVVANNGDFFDYTLRGGRVDVLDMRIREN